MSSINQVVSELSHALQGAENVPTRVALRSSIIRARTTLIRQEFEKYSTTTKGLQQRFRCSLIEVPDGDIYQGDKLRIGTIKRSKYKLPKPIRLTNGLPFHSVRSVGVANPIEIPYVKEASSDYYNYLPGMACMPTYDYINGYLYINTINENVSSGLGNVIVESVFEIPQIIEEEHFDVEGKTDDCIDYDAEWLIGEDMIPIIKKIVLESFAPQVVRQTNEIPNELLTK